MFSAYTGWELVAIYTGWALSGMFCAWLPLIQIRKESGYFWFRVRMYIFAAITTMLFATLIIYLQYKSVLPYRS